KRPDIVSNGFAVPRTQRVFGHSVTSTWQASDSLSVKNISAYRKASVFSPTPIDGTSNLNFTQEALQPFALFSAASSTPGFFALPQSTQDAIVGGYAAGLQSRVGQRLLLIAAEPSSISKQWSSEFQLNY